jgi:hypothetical protein
MSANWVDDGADKYIANGFASRYLQIDGAHRWSTAGSGSAGGALSFTDAMTLDASGNLTLSNGKLTAGNSGVVLVGRFSSSFPSPGDGYFSLETNNTDGSNGGLTIKTLASDTLSERARITAAGELVVGKTAIGRASVGFETQQNGITQITVDGSTPANINRLTDDGTLIGFYQANSLEGTISVSGSTVSYNGGHLARWSQFPDGSRPELLKGTVMSNLDQMAEWIDPETGEPQQNEQLNCMKVSDVEGDVNVAGVFVNWDNDDDVFANDMNIAMTGDMIIRIAQGVTVQRGDLLMSAGDGTAKPQGDDIIRSKTIAKVTSTHVTCTYEDGSYCVPCVLMAC